MGFTARCRWYDTNIKKGAIEPTPSTKYYALVWASKDVYGGQDSSAGSPQLLALGIVRNLRGSGPNSVNRPGTGEQSGSK